MKAAGENVTILHVEDDRINREMIALLLNRAFPEVSLISAGNGREGLDVYREHTPEIVLTDLRMPVMDGIQMSRAIKALNRKARIIITTADGDAARLMEAIEVGVEHYVLKPIDHARLVDVVRRCLDDLRQERQLREQETFIRKLSLAVEQSPVAILITDPAGRIEYVNPRFTAMTGYSLDEVAGQTPRLLKSGETEPEAYHQLWTSIVSGGTWSGEFLNRRKDGETFWVLASISPVSDSEGNISHFIAFEEEITARKEAEETIRRMAYYDALTGLASRQLFGEMLQQSLAQAQRDHRLLAVLFLDLDRFKEINDTYGHSFGDEFLQAAAQRLKGCFRRERDIVARRGGDEFIVLLPQIENIAEAVHMAENILQAFDEPFSLGGKQLAITTSIGVAVFPEDGRDAETLIKNADMAMYRAKERGRNRFCLFDEPPIERTTGS